jgi:hypothetical protein
LKNRLQEENLVLREELDQRSMFEEIVGVSPALRRVLSRIARVITRLNIGGPSIQAITLSERLDARGFETQLVHGRLGQGEGDMAYLLAPSTKTTHLASLCRPLSPFDDAVTFARLLDILRDWRPHLVHTHMAKAGTLARAATAVYNATAGRGSPARGVHTYHGHVLEGYFSPGRTRVFIGIERQLAKATDRIVAISPQIQRELLDEHRIGRADQYRVVPLGFDLAKLAVIDEPERTRARTALGIAEKARVVTTVGRWRSSSTICSSRRRRWLPSAIRSRVPHRRRR